MILRNYVLLALFSVASAIRLLWIEELVDVKGEEWLEVENDRAVNSSDQSIDQSEDFVHQRPILPHYLRPLALDREVVMCEYSRLELVFDQWVHVPSWQLDDDLETDHLHQNENDVVLVRKHVDVQEFRHKINHKGDESQDLNCEFAALFEKVALVDSVLEHIHGSGNFRANHNVQSCWAHDLHHKVSEHGVCLKLVEIIFQNCDDNRENDSDLKQSNQTPMLNILYLHWLYQLVVMDIFLKVN